MEDALSIFLVSGRLYKVHRYLLSQSVAFRDMFTCPPGPNAMVQGETDADPITLQGVTQEEFEALLDVFYDSNHDGYSKITLQQWMHILSIASVFQFDNIRERAIREITKHEPNLDAMQEIELALKHEVRQWALEGLAKLLLRPEVLDEDEASRLPLGMVVKLWKAREEYVTDKLSRSPHVRLSHRAYVLKHFDGYSFP
ncbi:hypothetical protein HETIRDRAFT_480130 [Heterobasidion irregulare TC 32-1]|uniref:BTB domain-containing protein n=1 Tax=Heterobasidion irregulare (strain TC 32-1) TaxID=747525 RepID=W4JX66_HETIT|nr:uncharacterized protein HETIRDRAFT_480130 [Heterobasidion irregulare TC 32-1]ETW77471.1 hypothetical protein HETIRDRAFT_480130 [Heterobasidion irregulare TC 32-1]